MRKLTRWAEWKAKFHKQRDELRVFLRSQRTEDLQAAFSTYEDKTRGQLISKVLCDYTREFHERMDAMSDAAMKKREEEIDQQIQQFKSL